ncbi:MAG: biotin/lipoyl-binding protein [Candidatus Aminicenantes bacterium]|nr:biotin/lipoyl-binding protein [Candidatus Aminicenantes bacterium]
MDFSFSVGDREYKLKVKKMEGNGILVTVGKKKFHATVDFICPDEFIMNINGRVYDVIINAENHSYSVCINGKFFEIEKKTALQLLGTAEEKSGRKEVKTSMPGRIVEVLVEEGDRVKKGQPVLVLEAMKMQNEIKAPQPGKVTELSLNPGDSVEANAHLFAVVNEMT